METIRFIDLLANVGELRKRFEKAFQTIGAEVTCVLSSSVTEKGIVVFPEDDSAHKIPITELNVEQIPSFDFLLTAFCRAALNDSNNPTLAIQQLFSQTKKLLEERQPYGFIIENMNVVIDQKNLHKKSDISRALQQELHELKRLGYKLSWKMFDSEQIDLTTTTRNLYIVGTLGSATVLANMKKSNIENMQEQSDFLKWLLSEPRSDEDAFAFLNATHDPSQVTEVQKELLSLLLAENRKKDVHYEESIAEFTTLDAPKAEKSAREEEKPREKQVYFELYPPKKLVEITEEDGSVTGLVHSFIFQEVFEETAKELDFTRHLISDLKALLMSSGEQILVIDANGKIIRVAGTFLNSFWRTDDVKDIIGKPITYFVERNIFQPNVFELCKTKKEKVTAIQESGKQRIWSVATPVYKDGKLEKVVVLSKKITAKEAKQRTMEPEFDPVNLTSTADKRLIYRSKTIENLVMQLSRVAKMNSTVLLEGETGVGKEVFAHKIHELSSRNDQPMIRINCGAIPEQLMESELFGYEKGSFTGADRNGKIGYFELAHKGTIFLDEIAELSLNMQVKLLRVLQEREITRIGGTHPISIDVRIIAATNQNLQKLVDEGKFREDLYYRLNVIPFNIPPLRERKEDIFPLAVFFLEKLKKQYEMEKSFTPEAIEVLETYDWPGNVRELQNIIERLLVISDEEWITREHALLALYGNDRRTHSRAVQVNQLVPLQQAIEEVEEQLIDLGLKRYKTAAELSKVLQISPASLSRRMKRLAN